MIDGMNHDGDQSSDWYTETSAHGGLGPETSAQAVGDLGPNWE